MEEIKTTENEELKPSNFIHDFIDEFLCFGRFA